jgi:hypothetical protein
MNTDWKLLVLAVGIHGSRRRDYRLERECTVTLVTPRMAPPVAQRAVAMVQVAMFDAVNSIERRYCPYLVQLPAPPTASKEAGAAVAAGVVLARLLPQADGQVKSALASYLAAIRTSDAKSAGINLGEEAAARVLEVLAKDESDATDANRPKAKSRVYVPTPITVGSTWPNVAPFVPTSRERAGHGPKDQTIRVQNVMQPATIAALTDQCSARGARPSCGAGPGPVAVRHVQWST